MVWVASRLFFESGPSLSTVLRGLLMVTIADVWAGDWDCTIANDIVISCVKKTQIAYNS